ncbi:hypothetical protein F4780DRAFT_534582 [Xylariomycetidae sp. FL0641]|nr:hypothetical protein F4780DRAFT_534582 [Xylariomycetidae sp. FL0641]
MSRSLDKSILAQLSDQDIQPAFEDIANLLANLPDTELLEVELLGTSHPLEPGVNLLRDGLAVAIPKIRLVQAFFVAHRTFQTYLESGKEHISDNVLSATSILLLMDPEHLTAANTRKRKLVTQIEAGRNTAEYYLTREKAFVDTLLTARLHRHTKSPTLWSHRRWLLTAWKNRDIAFDVEQDIERVVLVAAERHMKNYPAWAHARFLLGHFGTIQTGSISTAIKEFCLRHHSDVSAWSFLGHIISTAPDVESRQQLCNALLADILKVTDSLRLTNESVWTFLRTVVATEYVSEQSVETFKATNRKLSTAVSKDTAQWKVLDAAHRWCDKYRLHHFSVENLGTPT